LGGCATDNGTKRQKYHGTMDTRTAGEQAKASMRIGTMGLWETGTVGQRRNGTMGHWTMGQWTRE
jgi:hypothetical protein